MIMTKSRDMRDDDLIATTEYMIGRSRDPQKVIAKIMAEYRPSERFLEIYGNYITPEIFMGAYRTTPEMRKAHPFLFDQEAFEAGIDNYMHIKAYGDEIRKRKEMAEKSKNISSMLGISGIVLISGALSSMNPDNKESIEAKKKAEEEYEDRCKHLSIPIKSLTLSDIAELRGKFDISPDDIKNSIRNAYPDEMTTENISNLIGISEEIDETLLEITHDENKIRDAVLMAIFMKGIKPSAIAYRYLDKDTLESIAASDDTDPKDYISMINRSDDLGWKIKMVENVCNGSLALKKTAKTFDRTLCWLMYCLPEDIDVMLIKGFAEYCPNAFSNMAMTWILNRKAFDEDQLIELYEYFRKAGALNTLMRHAKAKGYDKLMAMGAA